MSLLLTSKTASAWWDDFNSRLIAPCPMPRIILTVLPMRSDGRIVTALYSGNTVRLWRGVGSGPAGKWTGFHEFSHHLDEQHGWWTSVTDLALLRFADAALRRGANPRESFECALPFLMLGRWHAGCPRVRNLAPMLQPLLKETLGQITSGQRNTLSRKAT